MPLPFLNAGGAPGSLWPVTNLAGTPNALSQGVGYSAEALALFDRFTTPPTAARKTLINNLIVSLKSAGVWSKLDTLYVMAAADSQAARQNWIKDAHNLTAVGGPSFTADRGYDFDGASQYLRTGYVPSADAVNYALNSGSAFVWCRENVAIDGYALSGAGLSGQVGVIPRRGAGAPDTYVAVVNTGGTTGATTGSVSNSIGLTHADRSASALTTVYKNGLSATTNTVVSAALANVEVYLGARNNAGSPNSFDTRQQAGAGMGASLGAEAATLYSALNTYFQAVGAA